MTTVLLVTLTKSDSRVIEYSGAAALAQPITVLGPDSVGVNCSESYYATMDPKPWDPDIAYTVWSVTNSNASVSGFWRSATVTGQSSGSVYLRIVGYNQNDDIIATGSKNLTIVSGLSCS